MESGCVRGKFVSKTVKVARVNVIVNSLCAFTDLNQFARGY